MHIILLLVTLFFSMLSYGDDSFNELAENLAGIKGDESHIQAMNSVWHEYETKNLSALKEWQKSEIEPDQITKDYTVFYPFSGPDIVHMLTLFPISQKYVMVALEPTGSVHNLKLSHIDLPKLRKGLHSLLNRSFFVTKEMWDDFNIERNGVLVPIITLLKRMNAEILGIEPFYFSDAGKIVDKAPQGNNGIKITFKQQGVEYSQEIYYIRKSLTGSGHGFDAYLESQPQVVTYLKAAQYALFDPRFSKLRNAILAKSHMILQDDSGLPYRYFNNDKWEKNFYGNYEGPYGKEFLGYTQKDLFDAYSKHQAKELPFSLGYGYRKIHTILLKMVKKPALNASPS